MVSAPAKLLDAVAARTSHPDVHHLCRPSEVERVAAIALATAQMPARLHDVGKRSAPPRLQELSEEVGRIAHILASLSDEREPARGVGAKGEDSDSGPIHAGQIRAIIRARRLRHQYFDSDIFADPAWDMLLDLMAARIENQRVAVSSLCIAAAVPPTTALRWIKSLSDQGLFVRIADPEDGRRVFIELSDETAAAMEAYLKALQRISPIIA